MTVLGAIRAMHALADKCGQSLGVVEALEVFRAVVHENNALRRRNERLTETARMFGREAAALRKEVAVANRYASNSGMMASHWRLKANPESANYDERREDMPDAPTMPGTHGHCWDADGREVAS